MNAIFKRYSVRQFQNKEVEQEKIEKILAAAMQSPSAGGEAPWEFFVVRNRETLKELSHASPYASPAAMAPDAFVLAYKPERLVFPEYADIDMAIASENILIELADLGLGGVMLGIAPLKDRMKKVKEILNLPDNLVPFTIIPFGYPKRDKEPENRYDETRIHYVD